MAINQDKNINIMVAMPKELVKQIEDYQFNNRIKNRSEAIRQLIVKGLEK